MISESRLAEPEPVSPELVLVSPPDVAERARAELRDPPFFRNGVPPADSAPDTPAVPRRRSVDTAAPPARERRWPRIALAGALIAGIIAGIAYLTVMPRHSRSTADLNTARTSATPRLQPTTAPTTTAATTTHASKSAAPTAKPKHTTTPKPAQKPARAKKTRPRQATKPKQTTPKAKAVAPPTGFVPARTWTWPKSNGARAYEMLFVLKGHVVFRTRTTQPRLVLPRTFRFRAGTYRWIVQPIPAAANRRPIVESTFVLSRAAAARANR